MSKEAAKPTVAAEKAVAAPAKLDPRTITLSEYSKYQSNDMKKFAASLRSYKKSLVYLGGTLALSVLSLWYFNKQAESELFGLDCKH